MTMSTAPFTGRTVHVTYPYYEAYNTPGRDRQKLVTSTTLVAYGRFVSMSAWTDCDDRRGDFASPPTAARRCTITYKRKYLARFLVGPSPAALWTFLTPVV